MAVATLVVILVAAATFTDLKWRKIYNWLTYPGILGALGLNAICSLVERLHELRTSELATGELATGNLATGNLATGNLATGNLATGNLATGSLEAWQDVIGWVGLGDSALGLLACGGSMVVCYAMFRIGGGDVKLMAMIGAFLGLERGIESLLWTFVVGGGMSLVTLIWRIGAWRLAARFVRQLLWTFRLGFWGPLTAQERCELEAPLFLAPSALAAVAIVLASHRWQWF